MKEIRVWTLIAVVVLIGLSWSVLTSVGSDEEQAQTGQYQHPTNAEGKRIPPRNPIKFHLIPRMQSSSAVHIR